MADKHAHSTEKDTIEGLIRMGRQHMEPEITYGDCWEVSVDHGSTEWVLASVAGEDAHRLYMFVNGRVDGDSMGNPKATLHRDVYMARLSAPGYLDATDMVAFETRAEAEDYLVSEYDDGDDQFVCTLCGATHDSQAGLDACCACPKCGKKFAGDLYLHMLNCDGVV